MAYNVITPFLLLKVNLELQVLHFFFFLILPVNIKSKRYSFVNAKFVRNLLVIHNRFATPERICDATF